MSPALQLHRAAHQTLLLPADMGIKTPMARRWHKVNPEVLQLFLPGSCSPSAKKSPSIIPHLQCSKLAGYSCKRHHGETKPNLFSTSCKHRTRNGPFPSQRSCGAKGKVRMEREKGCFHTNRHTGAKPDADGSYSPGCGLN